MQRRIQKLLLSLAGAVGVIMSGFLVLSLFEPQPDINNSLSTQIQLAQYVDFLATEKDFHGSVLVVSEGRKLLHKGYGLASDLTQTSIHRDTVMDIGSITKMLTSHLVLSLINKGELSLDDRVATYFDASAPLADMTVRQLLAHLSGLDNNFSDDFDQFSRDQAIEQILALQTVGPAGEYAYSNAGYSLLGLITEEAAGVDYFGLITAELLAPLGMKSSGFWGDNRLSGRVSYTGYMNGTPTDYQTLDGSYRYANTFANGGLLSTTGDLYQWLRHINSRLSITDEASLLLDGRYDPKAFGWDVQHSEWGPFITHDGGGSGGNAYVAVYPKKELYVIVLSNRIEFNFPFWVSLPADELGIQVAYNLFHSDFSQVPVKTWPPLRW